MDERTTSTIEQLEGQRDALCQVAQVFVPQLRGIAAAIRDHGFDAYAGHVEDLARRIAATTDDTRLLIEQLSTLTDPRLEHTDPRVPLPPPPERG